MTVHSQKKNSLSILEKYYKFQEDKIALAERFDDVPFLCGTVTINCWQPRAAKPVWSASEGKREHVGV